MLFILDPETPGAFIASMDCKIASSSATHDDMLAKVRSKHTASPLAVANEMISVRLQSTAFRRRSLSRQSFLNGSYQVASCEIQL